MAEILGIMLTKYENAEHITGTVKAARKAGKKVKLFLTDEGVRFTRDALFLKLLKEGGVEIACCDHSCEVLGLPGKTEGIIYGSQNDNAGMLHDSSRILVF